MSIGALGTLPKSFKKWLDVLDMTGDLELLQRACLLGSARILYEKGPGILMRRHLRLRDVAQCPQKD